MKMLHSVAQRGEGVRDREPPSLLRSLDHFFLGHHGLICCTCRAERYWNVIGAGAFNSLLAGQVMGSPLDS